MAGDPEATAFTDEQRSGLRAKRFDSLLSDLGRNQPRMRNRARDVRLQYAKVRHTIGELRQELAAHAGDGVDFADYEAYYDAFSEDLRTAAPGDDES